MNYSSELYRAPRSAAACRTLLTTYFAAVMCAAALGCGDDSDDKTSDAGVTAGKSGGGGSGGASGNTSAAGAPAPPPPVPCGANTCTPAPSPLTGLIGMFGGGAAIPGLPMSVACCLEESTGTCGTAASEGATCEPPATPDARCPGFSLGALGAAAGGAALGNLSQGCCTSSNMCGLDGSIFGRGCVENGEAKAMLGPLSTFLTVPGSMACDAPAADDAGAGDAGI
jgi:hypothetical protein